MEKLETPPHLPVNFYKEHVDAFAKIKAALDKLIKSGILEDKKKFSSLGDWTTSADRRTLRNLVDSLDYLNDSLDRDRPDYWLKAAIDNKDVYSTAKYLGEAASKKILSDLQRFDEKDYDSDPDYQTAIHDVKQALTNDEYWDEEEYGTRDEQMKRLDQVEKLADMVKRMQQWYPIYLNKVSAHANHVKRLLSSNRTSGRMPMAEAPPHEKVETLYHATVASSKILHQGFKTRAQLGKGALGGGPDDLISFTADLQIAEAIVWAIRRAAEIAQGKIGYKQLEALGRQLGGDWDASVKYNISSQGGDVNTKKSFEAFKMKEEPRTPDDQRQWLFQLFRRVLAGQSRVYDPVFFGVTSQDFVNINVRDVAVLAAEVDMSQVKEYLPSMHEFRAPVSSILKVWRVPYRGIMKPSVTA